MKPFERLRIILSATFLLAAPGAGASTIYILDRDGCTGTCGIGPFATVILEQTTSGMVTISETLAASDVFAGSGAGEALEFNLLGPITIGSVGSGFAIGPAPAAASAFGHFLYSVTCVVCQGGKLTNPSELSFTVTSAAGVTIPDFIANDRGYLFASDIRGANGNTGNVAVLRSPLLMPQAEVTTEAAAVPEPLTSLLVGVALVAIGVAHRRASRY